VRQPIPTPDFADDIVFVPSFEDNRPAPPAQPTRLEIETVEYVPATPYQPAESVEPGLSRQDRIAARAYELYLERGERPGGDFVDWLDAEREIVD
jgi:Protein of unknown function (DUF2934)